MRHEVRNPFHQIHPYWLWVGTKNPPCPWRQHNLRGRIATSTTLIKASLKSHSSVSEASLERSKRPILQPSAIFRDVPATNLTGLDLILLKAKAENSSKNNERLGGESGKSHLSVPQKRKISGFRNEILVPRLYSWSKNTLLFNSTPRVFPIDQLVKNARCTRPYDYFRIVSCLWNFAVQSLLCVGL